MLLENGEKDVSDEIDAFLIRPATNEDKQLGLQWSATRR